RSARTNVSGAITAFMVRKPPGVNASKSQARDAWIRRGWRGGRCRASGWGQGLGGARPLSHCDNGALLQGLRLGAGPRRGDIQKVAEQSGYGCRASGWGQGLGGGRLVQRRGYQASGTSLLRRRRNGPSSEIASYPSLRL